MRPSFTLVLAAATLVCAAPLRAQREDAPDSTIWELRGLRSNFCVQLLLDPKSESLGDLPSGFQPVPATAAKDLHVSLRSVIEGQPEFGTWAPSRLCFTTVDAIRTQDIQLVDRSGKHPQLLGLWTVLAAGPSGTPQDVALDVFTNSERLVRSARLAGHIMREARLSIGKVPAEDREGVRSTDDRFQVKLLGATVIWDGRLAGDSTAVSQPLTTVWAAAGARGAKASGEVELGARYSQAMAGSLKVDGKSEFAKALRASPTRFAGPAYRGGEGKIALKR